MGTQTDQSPSVLVQVEKIGTEFLQRLTDHQEKHGKVSIHTVLTEDDLGAMVRTTALLTVLQYIGPHFGIPASERREVSAAAHTLFTLAESLTDDPDESEESGS